MKDLKKKKVLYFLSSGVIGGAEKFVETCLNNHSENIEAEIFFLNDGPFYEICLKNYKEVHLSKVKVRLKNPFSWFIFQFYFLLFLYRNKYDVVHTTMPYSQYHAALACWALKVRNVWYQHGPIGGGLDRVASLFPCDLIYFNSNYSKEEHLSIALRVHRSEIIAPVVEIKVNELEVQKIRNEYLQHKSERLIVCIGRVCSWKGYEVALSSLKNFESSFQLLIVGGASTSGDKSYLEDLKKIVTNTHLESKVHFLGFKKNIHDYMSASDLLIHSSLIPEPYGLVVSEALNCETHVLGVDAGGVAEQLTQAPLGDSYKLDNNSKTSSELTEKLGKFLEKDLNRKEVSRGNSCSSESQVFEMIRLIEKTY